MRRLSPRSSSPARHPQLPMCSSASSPCTTYLLGGIAREQVCIYMCPWPRIQAAMFDADLLLISYPHLSRRAARAPPERPDVGQRGDSIDCTACVAVCPTGIDIRDGSQLECIQCALCIDACNDIMDRVGRPRSLIGYDTIARQEAAARRARRRCGSCARARCSMPGLIGLVGGIMLVAWLHRTHARDRRSA